MKEKQTAEKPQKPSDGKKSDGGKKNKFREVLFESVGELVIELLLLAIGAGVVLLLGFTVDLDKIDLDLLVLIGVGVIAVIGIVIGGIAWLIKRKKQALGSSCAENKNKSENDNSSEDT